MPRAHVSTANSAEAAINKARELTRAGHANEAAARLSEIAISAHKAGYIGAEAKALLALSAARIRLFDYRGATQAAQRARTLALSVQDLTTAGGAGVNIASIYLQLGDYSLADVEAARAAEVLKSSPNKETLLKAMLIYANTEAERIRHKLERQPNSDGSAEPSAAEIAQLESNYLKSIGVAQAAKLIPTEAIHWEEMGYSLLLAHCSERAEKPLNRAWVLASAVHDSDALATIKAEQAELQLQKRNYRVALSLIDEALAAHSQSFGSLPRFYPIHVRGVLLAKLGRQTEALAELKRAVVAANEWRQGALFGDATRTRMVVVLNEVYSDYAHLAASLSLENHKPELAREALEVLAENRAANLREEITLALSRKDKLPPRYFDLLAELQSAQARVTLGENRPEDELKLEQVRVELGGVENEFGLSEKEFSRNGERISYQNSLRNIQSKLSTEQVLLSFSLGHEQSFLWSVSETSVNVYQLAAENPIAALARQFSQAVQRRQLMDGAGMRLSKELFGSLPADIWAKREWLIVGDGALLNGLPFSDLADISKGGGHPLAEFHNLRFIPSELLLLSADKVRAKRLFVGIGDPIYNFADSRAKGAGPGRAPAGRASSALSRLPGSEREVREAAKHSGLGDSEILVGAQANVSALQKAIEQKPEILHFAVHVVAPDLRYGDSSGQSSQAALALSLMRDGVPELLTPEAIATMRLPGSLVILSGCSSQKGEVLPGAGVMGLSRAWLLAGASAVVVSSWPTPDDSGRFFSSFYKHFDALPSGKLAERAAAALEQAQIEMEHGGGYRSAPNFWAAYSIISKE